MPYRFLKIVIFRVQGTTKAAAGLHTTRAGVTNRDWHPGRVKVHKIYSISSGAKPTPKHNQWNVFKEYYICWGEGIDKCRILHYL